MSAPTDGDAEQVGTRIRHWRHARGLSQMELALEIGVSSRHMSFVETGRSRPGRQVVEGVAEALGLPLREENALLEAAGYARRYPETDLDAPELEEVREVFRFLLDRHEPNSALVFDGAWDIVMSNRVHDRLVARLLGAGEDAVPGEVTSNLLRLTFHPDGLRPFIANWSMVGPVLMARVEAEARDAPSHRRLARTLEEVRSYGPVPPLPPNEELDRLPFLPVHLRAPGLNVRLMSIISTLGTARDVTLQELRMESFFPADEASERALRAALA